VGQLTHLSFPSVRGYRYTDFMLRRSLFALMVAAIVGTHPSAFMAQPSAAPDVDALGPQIGSQIPDFTLPDQHARQQSLSTLRGPKGLVLVFNRSADW
jgi:hypothetical protein